MVFLIIHIIKKSKNNILTNQIFHFLTPSLLFRLSSSAWYFCNSLPACAVFDLSTLHVLHVVLQPACFQYMSVYIFCAYHIPNVVKLELQIQGTQYNDALSQFVLIMLMFMARAPLFESHCTSSISHLQMSI